MLQRDDLEWGSTLSSRLCVPGPFSQAMAAVVYEKAGTWSRIVRWEKTSNHRCKFQIQSAQFHMLSVEVLVATEWEMFSIKDLNAYSFIATAIWEQIQNSSGENDLFIYLFSDSSPSRVHFSLLNSCKRKTKVSLSRVPLLTLHH